MNRIYEECNINIDKNNYFNKTVCKNCHNKNRRKNNKKTIFENENSTSHQQPKTKTIINNNVSAHEI